MDKRRAILLGAIPLLGLAVGVTAAFFRHREDPGWKMSPASGQLRTGGDPKALPWSPEKPLVVATPPPRPQAAPDKTVADRSEDVRIRLTYQNYRTAIATGNITLARAIRPAVLRDREAARQCAEQDLARAQNDLDRGIARRVLEDLGQ
jgi:hypothetical protein